jgi:hypothetical protein
MTTLRRIFTVSVFVLLLGAGGLVYESRLLTRELRHTTEEQNRQAALSRRLHAAELNRESVLREIAALRRDIAALTAEIPTDQTAGAGSAVDTGPWLARIQTIRHLFATHPETSIPELRYLQESDWILLTREAELDTDEHIRKSLAGLRDAGKRAFTGYLQRAMTAYVQASDGQLPPNVEALAPYFDPPVDSATLPRYEMLRSGNMKDLPKDGLMIVREKAAIDEDFDGRFGLYTNGGPFTVAGGKNSARTWISDPDGYDGMIRKARAQFAQANNGAKAAGLEQLAPYIDPPLPPEKLQKLIELNRESGNH